MFRAIRIIALAALGLAIVSDLPADQAKAGDGWTNLFNGKDLKAWVQYGGQAKYRVEAGQIVGSSVPNTTNSFLCTKKNYGDFILELEFKVDPPPMNSGVQIRSECFDEICEPNGVVGSRRARKLILTEYLYRAVPGFEVVFGDIQIAKRSHQPCGDQRPVFV